MEWEDQGGLRRKKCVKLDRRKDKSDESLVSSLLVSMLLWSCPVPGQCSLPCLLVELHLFPGRDTLHTLCLCLESECSSWGGNRSEISRCL